jgi:LmbE family N-acetylglucosaminyl deacetylase
MNAGRAVRLQDFRIVVSGMAVAAARSMHRSARFILVLLALSACVDADPTEAKQATTSRLGGTTKKQLQYIVTAHPDDEFGGWSLIEKSSDNYPVFIVLTRGEETAACADPNAGALQTAAGEQRPVGDPYVGKWTEACKVARLGSWHAFLDAMADGDAALSKPAFLGTFDVPGDAGPAPPARVDDGAVYQSPTFQVWADAVSARVAFDLGDGDLTAEEVTWAIQAVRARRASLFPIENEYAVIGASYRNAVPDIGCDVYDHPDHRAVHQALWSTDQGVPGPQWGRTCVNDPDVVATGGRIDVVDEDTFQRAMAVDAPEGDPAKYPGARRVGAFQVHYGWLTGTFWAYRGDEEDRRQAFWRRF